MDKFAHFFGKTLVFLKGNSLPRRFKGWNRVRVYGIAVKKLPENSIKLYKRRLIKKKGKDASMENLNERVNSLADFKGKRQR